MIIHQTYFEAFLGETEDQTFVKRKYVINFLKRFVNYMTIEEEKSIYVCLLMPNYVFFFLQKVQNTVYSELN